MRFSLTPPPPKAASVNVISPTTNYKNHNIYSYHNNNNNMLSNSSRGSDDNSTTVATATVDDDAASDYNQWLHAMKLVARLPGGTPPEFRRKLWLSLADKYLKLKNVDWSKQQEKCFCEEWREDDEELGIQIVKDLHRTGSNLCTGPAGSINQAKLKRILLGYARYNPEVGYCQGFNMLGALILQVMDKEEIESMKVMIYLVEGILPAGYFCGSMGGLQADMGVFRELMQTKLPRLAKHLQKLQGPIENAYEPPLTNVFTMQWFLTMFCTCLPMSCVLRVWDLVLIEGSDVLLRTALVLWSLLEERVLNARTADDFYCKMGSFSSELLNGHLIDSNGLIERVVKLGPIPDLQKLRDKHLYNIAPLRHKQGLQLYFDDEESQTDEESRLAVATVWGIPWGRRGSSGQTNTASVKQPPTNENKDRLALDISLLKKQYDRLRERQKQAHVILTTACTTAPRTSAPVSNPQQLIMPVNNLLMGRPAIITNRGRRVGPPEGAIPPARKPSLPAVLQTKPPEKQLRRGETLHWRDTDLTNRRRDSLTWKEIKADRAALLSADPDTMLKSHKLRTRIGKSDSSSYSEESDGEGDGSSTDTSLCDDDPKSTGDKKRNSYVENSPKRKAKLERKQKDAPKKLLLITKSRDSSIERTRPKSWAPTTHEIPFMLMTSDSPVHSGDEHASNYEKLSREDEDSATESEKLGYRFVKDMDWPITNYSPIAGDLASSKLGPIHVDTDILELPVTITSTSQLSPLPDITSFLTNTTISPLPTPKPLFIADSINSLGSGDGDGSRKIYDVNDDGVTNQYFERVNSVERPTKLELFYSLNEEDRMKNMYEDGESVEGASQIETYSGEPQTSKCMDNAVDRDTNRCMELLIDYSEKSSVAFIAEATNELSSNFVSGTKSQFDEKNVALKAVQIRDDNIPGENRNDYKEVLNMTINTNSLKAPLTNAVRKRRDPRRMTLTRSSTIELENRFQELQRRLSQDIVTKDHPVLISDPESDTKYLDDTKYIPTTADLEARYDTLEKQISLEKQKNRKKAESTSVSSNDFQPVNKPTNEFIPSTADLDDRLNAQAKKQTENATLGSNESDTEPIIKNNKRLSSIANLEDRFNELVTKQEENTSVESSESEKVLLQKPNNDRIPSTADLEDRFNALAKQMSASSSVPTNQINVKGDKNEKCGKPENDSRKESIPKKDINSASSQGATKNDVKNKTQQYETDAENPSIKKLPSTADLEDRFNALESKISAENTNSTPNKKKPPDEPNQKPKMEKTESDIHIKKGSEKEKINEKRFAPVDINETVKSDDEHMEKRETTSSRKKAPPSTEDLEKRFEALEKQLSTTSLDEVQTKANENTKSFKTSNDQAVRKTFSDKPKSTHQNEQTKKSFEDKCKSVNEKLQINDGIKTKNIASLEVSQNETTISCDAQDIATQDSKKRIRTFEEKCKNMSDSLSVANSNKVEEQPSSTQQDVACDQSIKDDTKNQKDSETTNQIDFRKRRASEPPSTEDLEKRYETLKRRMSSKNNFALETSKSETVDEALQRIEKKCFANISEVAESYNSREDHERHQSKPLPTTEDLESRFEALQRKDSKQSDTSILEEKSHDVQKQLIESEKLISKEPVTKSDAAVEAHIPEPPPMPDKTLTVDEPRRHHQRALIDELQSKIKHQPLTDHNLKPSSINPNRKRITSQRPTPMGDETSEAPANTAYYRLENYEPWPSHRMVRRFSDLPSRADLENRLQFLEKQLFKKFSKQRCAGDSEVASRRHDNIIFGGYDEIPSTSHQSVDLEKRVQALEKQLSENSLKLLEAMRTKAEVANGSDSDSPRQLSTETVDASGKELVRYTHFGEVEESDTHKPINISINIKMLLSKNGDDKKRILETLPSTEELEKRLESLEQELNIERAKNSNNADIGLAAESNLVNKERQGNETPQNEKYEKNNLNQILKSDNIEKCLAVDNSSKHELLDDKETNKKAQEIKHEISNETQTINNQHQTCSKESINKDFLYEVENTEKPEKNENVPINETVLITPNEDQNQTLRETSKTTDDTLLCDSNKENIVKALSGSEKAAENIDTNTKNLDNIDANNKTLVLLLDNEPKAVKLRRLTRANTEELEDLFQALEKQLSDRNLIKSEDGKLVRADSKPTNEIQQPTEESKAISNLSKEIQEFTSYEKPVSEVVKPQPEEDFDWGEDPIKRHLKRKTVYLPSTKELEARFRSLERQIRLLEDVEKIDVEKRLIDIERKIKLQYSLSHEKDLNKYLELCEGKGLDDEPVETPLKQTTERSRSPGRKQTKSPYTSPSRVKEKTPHTSPVLSKERSSPHTSPIRATKKKQSPYSSPARRSHHPDDLPISDDLEYRYRVLDLVRSKSKDNLSKKKSDSKIQPIHPLEMLLDSTPDESDIPTTGELEHRIRVLDGKLKSPSTAHHPRCRSPTIDDIKNHKLREERRLKTPVHNLETLVTSPTKREPPTEDELEARMRALEREHTFDFKTQKNYKEFNQKLKDVISPSLSFEEFKDAKSREQSPKRGDISRTSSKSALRDPDADSRRDDVTHYRSTSPKVIRFLDEEDFEDERPNARAVEKTVTPERMTFADTRSSSHSYSSVPTAYEGLDAMGSRLMRETSPLRRTGTHTGVPLRTDDNINDRLTSIKNSIKSIDTLCEEKPYHNEKCQRYIDSLFSDSVHFSSKKSSREDLTSRSESRGRRTEYTPAIRVSDHSQRPSEYYRSLGSAESIRTTSPLRAASPLHHRSNRDLRRDVSPRRRRDEEREEYESSRVRRDYMLPNYYLDNRSDLSSYGSLTKFHKVDRQLDTYKYDEIERSSSRSASRSPLRSPYGSRETMMLHNTTANTLSKTNSPTTTTNSKLRYDADRPVSPYRLPSHNLLSYDSHKRSNTPVYTPAKLEIRHTTVTSTFYDRLLTEKKIEKSLSRPPSRSPVVSPSVTSKSYTDLPNVSLIINKTTDDYLPPTTSTYASHTVTSGLGMFNSFAGTSLPSNSYQTTSTSISATNSSTIRALHTVPMSQVNLSTYLTSPINRLPTNDSHSDLRIRSCDNILMQLTTATSVGSTTTIPTNTIGHDTIVPTSTTTTQLLYSRNTNYTTNTATTSQPTTTFISNYTSLYNSTANSYTPTNPIISSTDSTNTTFTPAITSLSTGNYSPLISLTLRQPNDNTGNFNGNSEIPKY